MSKSWYHSVIADFQHNADMIPADVPVVASSRLRDHASFDTEDPMNAKNVPGTEI